jgi:UDP-glucose 4-epimerase
MSTMVTGGLGYVGRHLVAHLAGRGETVVSYNRDYAEGSEENVVYVQGELYDLPRFVDTLRRHEVRRIIHTAAMSHPDLSVDLPITTFTANVDGTVHVFEAARMVGVRRIVNFSSETAYGHIEGAVSEDAPLHPTTPYGVTKVATELLGDVYNDLYRLDVVSLRISEVYGPGNKMPQSLREMIVPALRGEPYRLEKGGDHRFQFVRVEDVVSAAVLAADVESPGQRVYNVTGGHRPRGDTAGGYTGRPRAPAPRPAGTLRHLGRRTRPRLHARVDGGGRHPGLRRLAARPSLLTEESRWTTDPRHRGPACSPR